MQILYLDIWIQNDLNNLNKPSYLFPVFGYKKTTSFGSIIEGKIYDNNMNYDNNK